MMGTFLIVAATLVAISVTALIVPLMRARMPSMDAGAGHLSLDVLREQMAELEATAAVRSDGQAEAERQDLERRAIEDADNVPHPVTGPPKPYLAVAVALALPALAAGVYWKIGAPATLSPAPVLADGNHPVTPQQIQAMVTRLADRLHDNPQDGEGWLMLARSYTVLGRYAESAAAFGRASELLPGNATLLADYADVLAMAQGRSLAGAPEEIISRALAADPNHLKALALAGSVAFERSDYRRAIEHWRKILTLVPADSGVAKSIGNSVAIAEGKIGSVAAVAGMPARKSVSGMVSVDGRLSAQIRPGDTLYVFARRTDGSPMPVAMVRRSAGELPLRFSLDDTMSMSPAVRLSSADKVIVGARISRSGDARASTGDLEGLSDPVAVGDQDVRVVISKSVQ